LNANVIPANVEPVGILTVLNNVTGRRGVCGRFDGVRNAANPLRPPTIGYHEG